MIDEGPDFADLVAQKELDAAHAPGLSLEEQRDWAMHRLAPVMAAELARQRAAHEREQAALAVAAAYDALRAAKERHASAITAAEKAERAVIKATSEVMADVTGEVPP